VRYLLPTDRIPEAWFNVAPHLPEPLAPPLHPGTRQPVGPDDLAPLFPIALIAQEVSTEPWIDVPGEVLDILRLWRPTPLVRARRLEEALGTPARIYYKDESGSPAGSHKPNTAVPQAFYNKQEGIPRLTTETGAGQWGSALGFPSSLFGLECKVYMVRASFHQKPYRRIMMETWGATVEPSPVDEPITRARSDRRSATPCATPQAGATRTTRSVRSSTTCCCIRPSSVSKPRSSCSWPGRSAPTS